MNIKNINGALFAMALVAASAGFTSCEDEPDKYEVAGGTPTIDNTDGIVERCTSKQ